METTGNNYLSSTKKLFKYYKSLAEKAIAQVGEEHLRERFTDESNGSAIIIKHIAGNSISRWTDFLDTDGEKESRNRDAEFD